MQDGSKKEWLAMEMEQGERRRKYEVLTLSCAETAERREKNPFFS